MVKNSKLAVFFVILVAIIIGANLEYASKFPKIEIYEVYHKLAPIYRSDVVIPIHAGRALHTDYGKPLENLMIGDDTGDNISDKNKRFAELTATYWIWKNSKADYVGLMHYRRSFVLDFDDNRSNNVLIKRGLTQEYVEKIMRKYDIVVKIGGRMDVVVYQNYKNAHIIADMKLAMKYIGEKYPEMKGALNRALMSRAFYSSNMFIMRKDIFDDYASWLFDVLLGIEDDLSSYDGYQTRSAGFLGERLFGVWLEYNRYKYRVGEFYVEEM